MQIRLEGSDLPGSRCGPSPEEPGGYGNIHVGVQRRGRPGELLDLTPADASAAVWTLDCTVTVTPTGVDVKGPWVQGPQGARFIYLSWGTVDGDGGFAMFRRAKLWLDAVPADVLGPAVTGGLLVGRVGLTDARGNPLCAAVRPPLITWSAR